MDQELLTLNDEQIQTQRQKVRNCMHQRLRQMTTAEIEQYRKVRSNDTRRWRQQLTEGQLQRVRARSRIYSRQRWLNMSDEQRQRRRERQRNAYHQRRLSMQTTMREHHKEDGDSQTGERNVDHSVEPKVGVMRNNVRKNVDHSLQLEVGAMRNNVRQERMRIRHIRQLARQIPAQSILNLEQLRQHQISITTPIFETQGDSQIGQCNANHSLEPEIGVMRNNVRQDVEDSLQLEVGVVRNNVRQGRMRMRHIRQLARQIPTQSISNLKHLARHHISITEPIFESQAVASSKPLVLTCGLRASTSQFGWSSSPFCLAILCHSCLAFLTTRIKS